jgi:outer membrane lipoprotein SlyB
MKRVFALGPAVLALAVAAGCATHQPVQSVGNAPIYNQQQSEYGRVQSIDLVRAESQTTGGGALVGGLVGAVVGRQIGSGSGRTAGTMVGAVGGALIGNQIEKNQRGAQDFYRVVVRTEYGQVRSFDYQQLADLRVGDRVRIEGNQVYRY